MISKFVHLRTRSLIISLQFLACPENPVIGTVEKEVVASDTLRACSFMNFLKFRLTMVYIIGLIQRLIMWKYWGILFREVVERSPSSDLQMLNKMWGDHEIQNEPPIIKVVITIFLFLFQTTPDSLNDMTARTSIESMTMVNGMQMYMIQRVMIRGFPEWWVSTVQESVIKLISICVKNMIAGSKAQYTQMNPTTVKAIPRVKSFPDRTGAIHLRSRCTEMSRMKWMWRMPG